MQNVCLCLCIHSGPTPTHSHTHTYTHPHIVTPTHPHPHIVTHTHTHTHTHRNTWSRYYTISWQASLFTTHSRYTHTHTSTHTTHTHPHTSTHTSTHTLRPTQHTHTLSPLSYLTLKCFPQFSACFVYFVQKSIMFLLCCIIMTSIFCSQIKEVRNHGDEMARVNSDLVPPSKRVCEELMQLVSWYTTEYSGGGVHSILVLVSDCVWPTESHSTRLVRWVISYPPPTAQSRYYLGAISIAASCV